MAEENTNTVVPPEPAADGVNAPTGDATQSPDPVAPAQGAKAEVAPQSEQTPQDGNDGIDNPEAYHKARAEKYERLFTKTEEQLKTLQQKLNERETEEVKALAQEYEAMKQELTEARADAEQSRLTAMKLRVGVAHGLTEDLAMRLVGDSEEALVEDAQRLSKAIPATRKANIGNPAGQSDGTPSWMRGGIDPLTGQRL